MTSSLFVGIDVGSQENVVCCLTQDDEKRPVSRFTVTNNRPGILEFQDRISKLAKQKQAEEILFGLEHTGCYSTHAAMYLQRHLDFGVQRRVYVFNPSLIREFKKSHYLSAPKNDRVDAWFIAAKLRTGLLPHPFTWSEPLMALQRLTRARYHLMQDLSRESNFLMTNLYLKFSDYSSTGPFKRNKLSATSIAVMEEFESVEELCEMPLERLIEFLVAHGKNRFENPEVVAKVLQKAARSSYRLPQSMSDSVNLAMASSIRVIRTVQEQLKALRKGIEDHLATIPQTLDSIPGIGPILASGIVAELDVSQFKSHAEAAKHAGLAWTVHQSGKFTANRTRLIHSGNRYLKYYMVEAANSVRVHDPVFAEYYAKKRAEPKEFAEGRTLALTARKLMRVVFYLLKTNRLYTPEGGVRQRA
ncbi:IS110 family transposase [Alicyclobacillus sp. SO9]|uniref:IS110 family transposase n=1 Tax=Alicyclobacillus sp. SO9 TaxID=2665646 RepID=UPI0018E8748C|nr:IS110 family transposase [Alicyclobacillus sp. SO9]QQE76901.1 IS110 family transposase [Alicyclobacillus sp. SO9]QQE78005.1 IS110 family transposase [Alicyclobacillus sp. SO9]QQE79558.1 IS110 family transposase [Alicyclobacillus sp. SO9]QQE79564.1 IS110 family transposase [Alicyclobacillus sp. SO9]QQE79719.1 IS110 family transposase [Alicyclobacillus sp. SO9]